MDLDKMMKENKIAMGKRNELASQAGEGYNG